MIFTIWRDIVLILSLNYLDMVFFSSLKTSELLKSLSNRCNIWVPQGQFLFTAFFFFLCMAILSCFFANLVIFCWKMGILSNMIWQLWKSYSTSSLEFIVLSLPAIFVGVLCLLIIWASSLKSVFSLMGGHWRLCPASVLVSWSADDWTELPLNTMDESGSQPLLRGSTRCWGFLSCSAQFSSTLAFSSSLCRASNSRGGRWGPVYVFPRQVHNLALVHVSADPQ